MGTSFACQCIKTSPRLLYVGGHQETVKLKKFRKSTIRANFIRFHFKEISLMNKNNREKSQVYNWKEQHRPLIFISSL